MNRASKTLLFVVLLVIVITAGYKYKQFVIDGEYTIFAHVPCEATDGACFRMDCDDAEEDCDPTRYKKVEMLSSEAPECLRLGTCETFSCPALQSSCTVTYCAVDVIEEGERCTL